MRAQLKYAKKFHDAGIWLLPVTAGQKYDYNIDYDDVAKYQTKDEIYRLFSTPTPINIGWVSGAQSNNLFTLDFETQEDFQLAREISPSFDEICKKTTLTSTAHGGIHAHVRLKNPNLHKTFKLTYHGEVVGDAKYSGHTIEPNSYLLEGGKRLPYTMIDGFKGIYEIDTVYDLQLDPFFSNLEEATKPETVLTPPTQFMPMDPPKLLIRGFGEKYMEILNGDKQGYNTRSDADGALFVRGVVCGRTEEELKSVVKAFGSKSLKFYDKGEDFDKRFHKEYTRAYSYVHTHVTSFDASLNKAVEYYKYSSIESQTIRRMKLGILSILRNAGSDKLHCLGLSVRQIAEESGLSLGTVSKNLKITRIKLVTRYEGSKASIYDVSNLVCVVEQSFLGGAVEECSARQSKLGIKINSDISRSKSFGVDADIVLGSLTMGTELSIKEWGIKWNNMGYRATKRKLELLESVGIVEEGRTIVRGKAVITYIVIEEITPERILAICEATNTFGAKKRQHEKYEIERENQYKWRNRMKKQLKEIHNEEKDQ